MENLTGPRVITDGEIIKKILNGEISLFEILIRRYNAVLYKIARSFGFNHQDAQDLLQDSHIAAFENLKSFGGRASYKTWISKIIIHKCLYRLKYSHGKHEVHDEDPFHPSIQPLHMKSCNQPEEYTLNKELASVLEKSLDKIPYLYRNVFVLREIEDFSTRETAELLNITEVNVKVRLNRARALLQKEIQQFYSLAEIYPFNLVYCDAVTENVLERISNAGN